MADFPRKAIRMSVAVLLLLLLCACTGAGGNGDETAGSEEDYPTVSFTTQTQETAHDGYVLYRGTVNMPSLILPDGAEDAQDKANALLRAAGKELIRFPYDPEAMIGFWENNPDFQPYVTEVIASAPLLGKQYCSVLFSAELRAGGLGSDYAYRGVTLSSLTGEAVTLSEALGMNGETIRLLYCAAFSADMEENPQYYDDPSGGVRDEWIAEDCFCLTGNGVMLWMPSDTVSLGASPLLTLDFDAIYALTGVRVKASYE